jgi:hypothetical protein
MKDLLLWWTGLGLGIAIGGGPLILTAHSRDPFDRVSSYLVWLAGMFIVAMVISTIRSDRVWRWALAVELGFPTAVVLSIVGDPEAFQVLPLTIVLSVIIAIPPAFAGAYSGKHVRRFCAS